MFDKLRLVILDYPKLTLESEDSKKAFSDMLLTKQINFERSSPTYVPMSALDMISTHYLIYDVSNPFRAKLILAIRTCFEHRARFHDLTLPIDSYIGFAPADFQKKFELFRKRNFPLVDCNAWFVDPEYSFAKTQVSLSELAYFMVVSFILRKGLNNWVGATNERFKASRWASATGSFEDGLIFTHPVVKDPHKLIMIDQFNYTWLSDCVNKYGKYLEKAYEIFPSQLPQPEALLGWNQIYMQIENEKKKSLQVHQNLAI